MSIDELNEVGIKHKNGYVYGYIILNSDIVTEVIESRLGECIYLETWCKIDEKTLGQYTGLKDKYDNKIFEGDIGWDEHNECYGVVKFEEGKFLYEWENIVEDLWEVTDNIEVCGNIYENEELLEETE
ncbi:hypothetical protein CPC87_06960 [Listeria monocytogenes]|nr:hypothetical protein [Listeria monocytogenes]